MRYEGLEAAGISPSAVFCFIFVGVFFSGEEGASCLSLCQHTFVPIASVAAVGELFPTFFFLLPELQELLLLRGGDGGKLAHEGCWGQPCWLGLVFPPCKQWVPGLRGGYA